MKRALLYVVAVVWILAFVWQTIAHAEARSPMLLNHKAALAQVQQPFRNPANFQSATTGDFMVTSRSPYSVASPSAEIIGGFRVKQTRRAIAIALGDDPVRDCSACRPDGGAA